MAKIFENEIYLSPSEAAQILGVSSRTLERWTEAGEMPAMKNGKRGKQKIMIVQRRTSAGVRYYAKTYIDRLASQLKTCL